MPRRKADPEFAQNTDAETAPTPPPQADEGTLTASPAPTDVLTGVRNDLRTVLGLTDVPDEALDTTMIAVYRIEGGRWVRVNTLLFSDIVESGDLETAIASNGPGMYIVRPILEGGRFGTARRVNISEAFARQHGWVPPDARTPPPPTDSAAADILKEQIERMAQITQRIYEERVNESRTSQERQDILLATLMKLLADRPAPPPTPPGSDMAVLLQAIQAQAQQFQQALLQMMQAQQQAMQMYIEMQRHNAELQLNSLKLLASRKETGADLSGMMQFVGQMIQSLMQKPETESLAVRLARDIIALSRELAPEAGGAAESAAPGGSLWQTLIQAVGPAVAERLAGALFSQAPPTERPPGRTDEGEEVRPTERPSPPAAALAGRRPPAWMERFRTTPVITALAECDPDAIRLVFLQNFREALNYTDDPERATDILLTALPGRMIECLRSNPQVLTFNAEDCDYFGFDATLARQTAQTLVERVAAGASGRTPRILEA